MRKKLKNNGIFREKVLQNGGFCAIIPPCVSQTVFWTVKYAILRKEVSTMNKKILLLLALVAALALVFVACENDATTETDPVTEAPTTEATEATKKPVGPVEPPVKTGDIVEQLIDGIEKHYGESGKTQREYDIYMAVATLLGLEGEVKLK